MQLQNNAEFLRRSRIWVWLIVLFGFEFEIVFHQYTGNSIIDVDFYGSSPA